MPDSHSSGPQSEDHIHPLCLSYYYTRFAALANARAEHMYDCCSNVTRIRLLTVRIRLCLRSPGRPT